MKQFLAVQFLGLVVISALIEARPRGGRRGGRERSGESQNCQTIVPCDVNGQTLDDCKDDCKDVSTCASEPVTLIFNGQDYNVKVCVSEGQTTNNITNALTKKACEVVTGRTVQASRICYHGDACSGGPVLFPMDGDTVTATFCQANKDTFVLEDFLEGLGEHHGRSSSSEDSSESR